MKIRRLAALALGLAFVMPAFAQEKNRAAPEMSAEHQAMMDAWRKAAAPGAPHKQLMSQFEGTWDTKISMWMDPSAEPIVETGKSLNTPVFGGRHLRMQYSGRFMGQPFEGIGYSGYDNVKRKYVSSWMDNMSTSTFLVEGDYDPSTRTYTYRGQMPDPTKNGELVSIRESVHVVDNDRHVFEMYEMRDGKEVKTMQIEYTRTR